MIWGSPTFFNPPGVSSGFYGGDAVRLPTATPPNGKPHLYHKSLITPNEDRLRSGIIGELASSLDLGDNEKLTAENAAVEAVRLVSPLGFGVMPWIGFTDDGVLMLQWQRKNKGVTLFFSGDGEFSYSTKSGPDDHYTSDFTELMVSDGIPLPIRSEIAKISAVYWDDSVA